MAVYVTPGDRVHGERRPRLAVHSRGPVSFNLSAGLIAKPHTGKGMPSEFEELIRQQGSRIHRIARRYAARNAVDDLVQDILVRLWRSYPTFRAEAKVETWVYRVALNAAMTHVKTLIGEREGQTRIAAHAPGPATVPAGSDMAGVLESFLGMLSDIDAAILMMYLDGLAAQDMSRVLGITANAISVRINRLKQKFSDAFID